MMLWFAGSGPLKSKGGGKTWNIWQRGTCNCRVAFMHRYPCQSAQHLRGHHGLAPGTSSTSRSSLSTMHGDTCCVSGAKFGVASSNGGYYRVWSHRVQGNFGAKIVNHQSLRRRWFYKRNCRIRFNKFWWRMFVPSEWRKMPTGRIYSKQHQNWSGPGTHGHRTLWPWWKWNQDRFSEERRDSILDGHQQGCWQLA